MSLREFEYIDEAVELLNDITPTLHMLSEELVKYFEGILNINEQEYLNVNSRVKSEYSLREKIIRNKYLNKYKTCLLYTSPSPRDGLLSRMPSSA